jgi:hypothetical protein
MCCFMLCTVPDQEEVSLICLASVQIFLFLSVFFTGA